MVSCYTYPTVNPSNFRDLQGGGYNQGKPAVLRLLRIVSAVPSSFRYPDQFKPEPPFSQSFSLP